MKQFKDKLEKRVEDGLLRKQSHPYLPLEIYNYTEKCQFGKKWDKYSMMCRGLTIDSDGEIVTRPFDKFFNLGEYEESLEELSKKHGGIKKIVEKMDGSLIIVSVLGDDVIVSSRGSFTSEQAIFARTLLADIGFDKHTKYHDKVTYLFEIIYPENRIVVNYNYRTELVFLGARETKTGNHLYNTGFDKIFTTPKNYLKMQSHVDNEEGYVIIFNDDMRVKIKFNEYVRLHRIMTGFSERRVWDLLRNGETVNLTGVPEEFAKEVEDCQDDFMSKYNFYLETSEYIFQATNKTKSRGDIARKWTKHNPNMAPILFAMLDGKEVDDIIWRKLKP